MRSNARRLRIGIDGHVLGKNIGGVERYVTNVVQRVPRLLPQHDFLIFVGARERSAIAIPPAPNMTFVELSVSDPLIQRSFVLPWVIRRHRIDILQVQRIAPPACGSCKLVLTVHDLIPISHASDYPGLRNSLVRLLTPASVRRADLILCPTQTVCDELATVYPGARAPCRPFYNGVDPARFAKASSTTIEETLRRHAVSTPFVYAPGAVERRKNLEVLIAALAGLAPDQRPALVLSGPIRDREYFDHILKMADGLGVAPSVRHLGFVSEADLATLYSGAAMCVAPSRDEGFNLMPLEAIACEARVLCSDIPVHRELYQGAVTFFAHDQPVELAALMMRFSQRDAEPCNSSVRLDCLRRLSWDAMADRMAAMFDDLAQTVT